MEKYIVFNLEDEKSRKLGEAISNPNCKKVINLLAEQELTASEISKKLSIPLNALDYNLKKLIDSGIIEKGKHFWSVKGKKIPSYRVVNKVIVIQPKKTSNSNVYSKLKGLVPVVLAMVILTLVIGFQANQQALYSSDVSFEKSLQAPATAPTGNDSLETTPSASSLTFDSTGQESQPFFQPWVWFALGALLAMVIVIGINWRKL